MRSWVSALLFLGVGALLSWLGAARFDAAWPGASRSLSGRVADADTRVVADGIGRTQVSAIRFDGRADEFRLVLPLLPRPAPGQLIDAARVTIDYDGTPRDGAFVVTGLTVDGRVYFTPVVYRLMSTLPVLIVLVPGLLMLGAGAGRLYRLCGFPLRRAKVRPPRPRRAFAPVLVYSSSAPRKTADGEWPN